ncbi:MAG: hypothetical protein GX641_04360 [Mollicutes bacterium]|jgi:hypothetical protein|nr:hypothetical protein [Mollicutes bacterium]
MKKALATCLLLATIGGTLFSGVAAAGLKYTGTGWWSYGTTKLFGGGTVYSNLTDAVFQHSTSVKNAKGVWGYSGTKTQELKPRLPKQLITLEQIMHTTKFLILFHNYSYA